ncbi:hypothetical protein [Acidithiobacillus ferriphilus]|uniref:hypothetical protein n=1 Tax=Acidithiobacillus ferriphilus TaxID=1689834 RepID=UPI001C064E36|nr:hypothetical protein [Acidithiobacillus ferriphilus]MBU2853363.1 hypothetical protein [Acidithiobacillus ferriphilus]
MDYHTPFLTGTFSHQENDLGCRLDATQKDQDDPPVAAVDTNGNLIGEDGTILGVAPGKGHCDEC